ncbi:hypothetical protein MK489_03255 [Myxococcota bacterium]|nr:hypothetical protein [Myxococcota bacterium]
MGLFSSSRRRLLAWLFVVGVTLAIGFSLLAGYLGGSLLSHVLGVPVSVGWASVSLVGQHAKFRDVVVSNPPGFGGGDFLRSPEVRIELRLATLLEGPVVLPSIEILGLKVWLRTVHSRANYGVILENLGPSEPTPSAGARTKVDQVRIEDITAHVQMFSESIGNSIPAGMRDFGRLEVRIPEIILRNIGSEHGGDVTTRQATSLVTRAILVAVARKTRGLPKNLSLEMLAQASQLGGAVLDVVGGVHYTGELASGVERAAGDVVGAVESFAERVEAMGRPAEP